MNASLFFKNTLKSIKANTPEILTALGVTGVITTAYLTNKAAVAAHEVIIEHEKLNPPPADPKERLKERTKLVWKLYIPATTSGVITIGCIIGATRSGGRKTAAAVTAYSVTERAFHEYRERVADEIGKGKEQKIRDEIAQDAVNANPITREVVVAGTGHVLCYEMHTGRYLQSTMETLKKAENKVNSIAIRERYVTLDEFYDLVGLDHTSVSDKIGWTSDKIMELEFSTILSRNGEPCIAFDYNYIGPI